VRVLGPSLKVASPNSMDQLIPIINKLQDVFNTIESEPVDLPQIVVCCFSNMPFDRYRYWERSQVAKVVSWKILSAGISYLGDLAL